MTVTPEYGFPLPADNTLIATFPQTVRHQSNQLEQLLPGAMDQAARVYVPGEVSRQTGGFKTLAQTAAAEAEAARAGVTNLAPRVDQLETIAGTGPGDVTDAAVANAITQNDTQAAAAVDTRVAAGLTPAVTALDALAALRVPRTIDKAPALGLTLPVQVARTRTGEYLHTVNPEARHIPATTGPRYYVNRATGSNSNDGLTPATAFQTPAYAALTASSNAAEIIIAGGIYPRAESITGIRRNNLTLRAAPGERVVMSACDVLTAWTNVAPGVYRATLATCNGVLDDAHRDVYGEPYRLRLAANASELATTAGTWMHTGGEVHVHLPDNRVPDSRVYCSRTVNSLAYSGLTGANGSTYVEGITWWGGTTANLTAPGDGWRFLAKNCAFNYAGSANGLSVRGLAEVQLLGCHANGNALDGFNYHDHSGRTGQVIEAGCTARDNGHAPGSNNGSSAHENYRVLRVAGDYYGNQGANVADVNQAASHNIGLTAADSRDYGQDYYTDATMWLDGCVSRSPRSFVTAGPGIIHARDCVAAGQATGTIAAY